MRATFWLPAIALLVAAPALAKPPRTQVPLTSTETHYKELGEGIDFALPAAAAGIAIYKHDWVGVGDLLEASVLTVGTAYALSHVVVERQPDGQPHSFPSVDSAIGASGSSFLWARYGWEYGLPAFAIKQVAGYSLDKAKQGHWYDSIASSAIASGFSYFITPRFSKYKIYTELDPVPGGGVIRLSYNY
jgi:hypothetical protein